MENKKRFKLYKSGKLWCTAAVAFASLTIGSAMVTGSAHADTTSAPVSDPEAAQVNNQVPKDTTTSGNQWGTNQGHLDSTQLTTDPQTGQATLNMTGWHASGRSNNESYRYAILFDNTTQREVQRVKVAPQTRPDVQKAYPHVDNSINSGFNVNFKLPTNLNGHSVSMIARYSTDAVNGEGQRTDLWFAPIILNNDNRANLDGLSTDEDGHLHVTGWHASNQAWGKKYHYIIAYDQSRGREIARQKVTAGQNRQDVAKAFPGIANANISGFNVEFQLNPEYARGNVQFISRWTDDPAGNGHAVDYWFGPVVKQNRGNLDSWNLSDGGLHVTGWHANDESLYAPYHFLIVYDNTTGRQVANKYVPVTSSKDVAEAITDTRTAGKSRFNYDFGDLHFIAGHTYSLISRYSVTKYGDGNDGNSADHVDYWYPAKSYGHSAYHIDSWEPTDRSMKISGWFANDAASGTNHAFVILLDGDSELGRSEVTLSPRQDVANAYPEMLNSLHSGFNTTINFSRPVSGDLQVVLRFTNDPAGNQNTVDIYTNKYATNAANFDNIKVQKNSIHISGWHAADNIADKPYQYIIAMDSITHREIQRWNVTSSAVVRNDVAKAYPWITNSGHSGFSLNVNGVDLTNRTGVYFIHRYTNDPNGNGDFVDIDSSVIPFVHANMYANRINAFIANNHIGHAQIQTHYVIPANVAGGYNTPDGKPNMVVVHETANPNDSIWGEINFERTHYNSAFVHAFVDGNNIIEISSTDNMCWGAGPVANARAVQFEQVEVYGRDNFVRELVNAAYYTAYKMQQYGMIPTLNGSAGTLMSHHMVSQYLGGTNHVDPDDYWHKRGMSYFGSNYTMSDFFELVKYEYLHL